MKNAYVPTLFYGVVFFFQGSSSSCEDGHAWRFQIGRHFRRRKRPPETRSTLTIHGLGAVSIDC